MAISLFGGGRSVVSHSSSSYSSSSAIIKTTNPYNPSTTQFINKSDSEDTSGSESDDGNLTLKSINKKILKSKTKKKSSNKSNIFLTKSTNKNIKKYEENFKKRNYLHNPSNYGDALLNCDQILKKIVKIYEDNDEKLTNYKLDNRSRVLSSSYILSLYENILKLDNFLQYNGNVYDKGIFEPLNTDNDEEYFDNNPLILIDVEHSRVYEYNVQSKTLMPCLYALLIKKDEDMYLDLSEENRKLDNSEESMNLRMLDKIKYNRRISLPKPSKDDEKYTKVAFFRGIMYPLKGNNYRTEHQLPIIKKMFEVMNEVKFLAKQEENKNKPGENKPTTTVDPSTLKSYSEIKDNIQTEANKVANKDTFYKFKTYLKNNLKEYTTNTNNVLTTIQGEINFTIATLSISVGKKKQPARNVTVITGNKLTPEGVEELKKN